MLTLEKGVIEFSYPLAEDEELAHLRMKAMGVLGEELEAVGLAARSVGCMSISHADRVLRIKAQVYTKADPVAIVLETGAKASEIFTGKTEVEGKVA